MSKFGFYTNNKVYLQFCPKCDRENYGPSVAFGQCAWCGYEATKEDVV